jgi:hypothetical protein
MRSQLTEHNSTFFIEMTCLTFSEQKTSPEYDGAPTRAMLKCTFIASWVALGVLPPFAVPSFVSWCHHIQTLCFQEAILNNASSCQTQLNK